MSKALPVAGVCIGLALAFSAPLPAAEQTVRFNIPAQPLADALLEFSDSSGVEVFFSSDDARNIRTRGLSGNYTSAQGLRQLLAETNLVARETGTGAVTVVKSEAPPAEAQPQNATTLKAMTVEGEAVRDPNDPYNPDYNHTHASTATKTERHFYRSIG
jgi:iron complex outermembrane recepter protein